ncbi:amidohydrolase family protein [Erwinia sp.]|uniref:amidohydrolase family protein n=1 Tax=Erwinia citreus TaxID=558 RepID=UPI003C72189B
MNAVQFINARLAASDPLQTLWVEEGRFVAPPARADSRYSIVDLQGKLVLPGLVETHLHLDKACILSRCELHKGTLGEAIEQTRLAKATFSEEDVYQRGAKVLEQAILQGTSWIRTHVEIDPQIGLTGFNAIKRLKEDYAWAVDLRLCVFPQEGLLNNPGTEELLEQALASGADLLGGCPYTDSDPRGQIDRLFAMADRWQVDLDFHLDFDLQADSSMMEYVMAATERWQMAGRVTLGHATRLSALAEHQLLAIAKRLAKAGVQITALPSTDLFLNGRDQFQLKPRGVAPLATLDSCGVTCSLSSNNIGNPFTPYGDASLVRQANLFANVSQLATSAEMLRCLAWISSESAKMMRLSDYGLTPGCQADFVVFESQQACEVVREIALPVRGFKRGRQTFSRPAAQLFKD